MKYSKVKINNKSINMKNVIWIIKFLSILPFKGVAHSSKW